MGAALALSHSENSLGCREASGLWFLLQIDHNQTHFGH